MAILPFRTSTYARNIYFIGVTSFATIPSEYVQPVKQYAATSFTTAYIDSALANGWITQEEYDETIQLINVEGSA